MARTKRAILEVWLGDKRDPQLKNRLECPTNSEIENELRLLPGGKQISSVEIHISKTHYIAVGGSQAEGFDVRYHEFSRAGEWEGVRDDISLGLTTKLLCSYRDQHPEWKNLIEWQRRPISALLEKQREDREIREILGWFGKAVGFTLGLFDAFGNRSRRTRPPGSRNRRAQ
jgi:hypothetical protein